MISQNFDEVEKYLRRRLSDSTGYRGMHLAQHNRLPIEKLTVILESIKIASGGDWFIEPSSDDPAPTRKHDPLVSRRIPKGMNPADCEVYYAILDQIVFSDIQGVTATFNSLKKNIFPNLEGMGLLIRDASEKVKTSVKKAKLSEVGIHFLRSNDREMQKVFSSCNEKILKPMVEVLDSALARFDTISVYEMMLFLTDENTTVPARLDMVAKYKRLKKVQVIQLHETIKNVMSKRMGANVSKVEKLDWHNWWNESRQITDMLETVIGFNVYQDEQIMKAGNAAAISFNRIRSQMVKREALAWHSLQVKPDWQLHHILPLEYATSNAELSKFDSKENLLYIPAHLHRKIPRTSNLSIKFSYDATHVFLSNPLSPNGNPSKEYAWPREAGVAEQNMISMADYNKNLLDFII